MVRELAQLPQGVFFHILSFASPACRACCIRWQSLATPDQEEELECVIFEGRAIRVSSQLWAIWAPLRRFHPCVVKVYEFELEIWRVGSDIVTHQGSARGDCCSCDDNSGDDADDRSLCEDEVAIASLRPRSFGRIDEVFYDTVLQHCCKELRSRFEEIVSTHSDVYSDVSLESGEGLPVRFCVDVCT